MKAKHVWQLAKQTAADWSEDNATRLAAALAFYTVLSVAPLLVLAKVHSHTWNVSWEAATTMTDPAGAQLLFLSVPPAGPLPIQAVMLVSMQPTGNFGFL